MITLVTRFIYLIKNGHIIKNRPYSGNCHIIVKDLNGKSIKLANYLLAEFYGTPLTAMDGSWIEYADDDHLNLTLANLSSNSVPCPHTKNRDVWKAHDRIYIQARDERPHFTDKSNTLWKILLMPTWSWHYQAKDNRLGAIIRNTGLKVGINDVSLYHLRWAVEYYGATDDYFILSESLEKMKKEFHASNLVIDHIDSNPKNNCIWNLDCLTMGQNTTKNELVGKIFDPFYFYAVHTDEGYRVLLGKDEKTPYLYSCKESQDFLNLLQRFCYRGIDGRLTPSELAAGDRIGYDEHGTLTAKGDRIIDNLLSAEASRFQPYTDDGKQYKKFLPAKRKKGGEKQMRGYLLDTE